MHAGGGSVIEIEIKGFGLTPPAPDGRDRVVLQLLVDVDERGRARSAVEIFVGAPDGEIYVALVEFNRDRASCMTQVPQHERTFAMGEFGNARHIVQITAFECDM